MWWAGYVLDIVLAAQQHLGCLNSLAGTLT